MPLGGGGERVAFLLRNGVHTVKQHDLDNQLGQAGLVQLPQEPLERLLHLRIGDFATGSSHHPCVVEDGGAPAEAGEADGIAGVGSSAASAFESPVMLMVWISVGRPDSHGPHGDGPKLFRRIES
jgi:hypothetical protein